MAIETEIVLVIGTIVLGAAVTIWYLVSLFKRYIKEKKKAKILDK